MYMGDFLEGMRKSGSDVSSELGFEEQPIVYDKIYVAVSKDFKENKLNLIWAMQNSGGKEIWIIHVLAPPEITSAGGKPPRIQWGKQELIADEEKERHEVDKALETYIEHCRKAGSRAQALCIEADSIVDGIITLILEKRIGRLVMGAAAENKYRKNMKDLKSEKAMTVYLRAPPFCHIQFVCKGSLVCTRAGVKPESSLIKSASVSATSDRKNRMSLDESYQFPEMRRSISAHPFATTESDVLFFPPDANNELLDQLNNVMEYADQLKMEVNKAIHKGEEMQNVYYKDFQVISRQNSSLRKELENYKKERDELVRERDNALSETESLRSQIAQMSHTSSHASEFFADFSKSEIAEATCNFDLSMKIGEGGYGITYKGLLRHTEVAIKVPKPDSSQGVKEFNQEVEVLSKLRHPNIVTLIGVCSEASALIYEFVPNGSLEDRLSCKDDTPPLSWQVRIRIARELCNVLIFLQSNKPESIVHGDLKPANILLDSNLKCKLSDFGICRGIKSMTNNTTMCHLTTPKGTFPYMDPLFFSTGELTAKSDVYSYGIILLRMLTGKSATNIRNEVHHAFESGSFRDVLDYSAGEWPIEHATCRAELAMRCCEMNRRLRPDVGTVWDALNR